MSNGLKEFVASGETPFPDQIYGPGYRCSAELKDGTTLPCVIIRQRAPLVDLAQRRLEEEKKRKGIFRSSGNPYRELLSSFLTKGNKVNEYDIARVFPSRYAIPLSLLKQIQGETVMSWTGFVFEMNNGEKFAFGTDFYTAFFDLPSGYEFDDVKSVFNHSYINRDGELRSIHQDRDVWAKSFATYVVHRARPFFECFI
jgi:hypothetical protein